MLQKKKHMKSFIEAEQTFKTDHHCTMFAKYASTDWNTLQVGAIAKNPK